MVEMNRNVLNIGWFLFGILHEWSGILSLPFSKSLFFQFPAWGFGHPDFPQG